MSQSRDLGVKKVTHTLGATSHEELNSEGKHGEEAHKS